MIFRKLAFLARKRRSCVRALFDMDRTWAIYGERMGISLGDRFLNPRVFRLEVA